MPRVAWLPQPWRRGLRLLLERSGVQLGFLRLRRKGYALVKGSGLEIGAFEHPARLSRHCRVEYADVLTREDALRLFPEIKPSSLRRPDHILDIDKGGLDVFAPASMDFVIACHVIEHVANPGRFVEELVRLLRPGGLLVIAAPDRDFTFDRLRPLTPLATLHRYFLEGRPPVGPEDYRDIVEFISPELLAGPEETVHAALERHYQRREHLSVWTDVTFRDFLIAAFGWCGAQMAPLYEVMSARSRFEYFGVWELRGRPTASSPVPETTNAL